MRRPGRNERVLRKRRRNRASRRFESEPHVNVTADEVWLRCVFGKRRRRLAPGAGSRNESGFEQDLRAVADAEDEFSSLGGGGDEIHDAIVRGDRSRANAIFVGKATRKHV